MPYGTFLGPLNSLVAVIGVQNSVPSLFFPVYIGIQHVTTCEPTYRSPFLAGTTLPLPRYTLSHPLGISRSNKRGRNVHN
jgi:hypothetical protein